MDNSTNTIVVGKIGAPHGIRGWVRINSYTEELEGIFNYSPWLISVQGEVKEYKVTSWKLQNKSVVAKLEGIDSRNDIELLKNADIEVSVEQLPELQDDDYYWRDLIGLNVVTESGYDMGTVEQLFETGANDVMMVKANMNDAYGAKQRMIPYLYDQVIKKVDLQAKSIIVDWDPGF
ncbi:ribosome maturation factor RimM [Paraneptunicella aestuarii]|uniref:ribosome maturation factor RimM n=1 Tax=Paraneptunicella aestuarii TaxID=2831148 RepID=UPI001E4AC6A5|nr:ribosome maturation factor RimM [Paraneptunicella aestuarii]UAA40120.1 ribosome maturation factor RimM [Paraneptunicella aestuarii]